MTYFVTVTYVSGTSDTRTCGTFEELSDTLDAVLATPGFVGYQVGPVRS